MTPEHPFIPNSQECGHDSGARDEIEIKVYIFKH